MIKTGFLIGILAVLAWTLIGPERLQSIGSEVLRHQPDFLSYLPETDEADLASDKLDLLLDVDQEMVPEFVPDFVKSDKLTEQTSVDELALSQLRDTPVAREPEPVPAFDSDLDSAELDSADLDLNLNLVSSSPPALSGLTTRRNLERYSLWPAFRSRTSAEGLAVRLQQLTGLSIETRREARNRYVVLLNCDAGCELASALSNIELQSGLTLLVRRLR